jgi:hypothetical protein
MPSEKSSITNKIERFFPFKPFASSSSSQSKTDINMMRDMIESKPQYEAQMEKIINDITSLFSNPIDTEISDMTKSYIENYTIGDLSKFVFVKNKGKDFKYCEYDMIDKFKKDLLMSSLIGDSENTYNYMLLGLLLNYDLKFAKIVRGIEPKNNQQNSSVKSVSSVVSPTKTGSNRSLRNFNSPLSNISNSSLSNMFRLLNGGNNNSYNRENHYNKFVQWNTLFGEFLHDFTSTRIDSNTYKDFQSGVEVLVSTGWNLLIEPKNGNNTDEYDYIRSRELYNAQPLNETRYVQTTIDVIQNNNPELLYDLDYTPLTTFSTSYYTNGTSDSEIETEIKEIYNKIINFFSGSVVIPRKKPKKSDQFCYVFYVLKPKKGGNENVYKNIELQMTDMNIDQNAVNARLMYSNSGYNAVSVFNTKTNPIGINQVLLQDVEKEISKDIPTLETYAKGLDPITRSLTIELEKISFVTDSTTPREVFVIKQADDVITSFYKIIQKKLDTDIQILTQYLDTINNYFHFTGNDRYKYHHPTDGNIVDTDPEFQKFVKLLLESFIGDATIKSMNELLNIWFNDKKMIDMFTQHTEASIEDNSITYNGISNEPPSYTIIKFQKTPPINKDDTFMFKLGSTTVDNVSKELVKILNAYQTQGIVNLFSDPNFNIGSLKTRQKHKLDDNSPANNLKQIIDYTKQNLTDIDIALYSLVLFFLNHIDDLHEEFNNVNIITGILMFIAFAKSCGDELQRLTCEKINKSLNETPPVFILTRDRIFVAKCLAELTPCVSTIILDQFNPQDDETTEVDQNDILIEGGASGRTTSVQTRGGVLITRISGLSDSKRTINDILKDRYEKGLKVYDELNKRIRAKLGLETKLGIMDKLGLRSTTVNDLIISSIADDVIVINRGLNTKIETIKTDENYPNISDDIIEDANLEINKIYTQNGRLTKLLESLELYNVDENYSQLIIDAEINTLALRLLSSQQLLLMKKVDAPTPSSTKALLTAIQTMTGDPEISNTLIEIYTTATSAVLTRIQESRANLYLYQPPQQQRDSQHTSRQDSMDVHDNGSERSDTLPLENQVDSADNDPNAKPSIDFMSDDKMITNDETSSQDSMKANDRGSVNSTESDSDYIIVHEDALYINNGVIEPIRKIIDHYTNIEKEIQKKYSDFLNTILTKLGPLYKAVLRSEEKSRSTNNVSYGVSGNDRVEDAISNAEFELENVNKEIEELDRKVTSTTIELNEILQELQESAEPNYGDIDKQLDVIIEQYDTTKKKSGKIISYITNAFKGAKKKLTDKANNALKIIEKYASKQRKPFQDTLNKLTYLINKKREQIKISPPKSTSTTLKAIIDNTQNAYTRIKTSLFPPRRSLFSRLSRNKGGGRNTKRISVISRKNKQHKRSNRRIRKIGVYTKRRRDKSNTTLEMKNTSYKKQLHKTRRKI